MARELSPRRKAFVRAYVAGPPGVRGNATRAAVHAGYAPKDADVTGPRLLGTIGIREAVSKRLDAHDITADRVMAEFGAIGFMDVRDFVSWGPNGISLKSSEELEHAVPIAEVSEHLSGGESPSRTLRVKFHDKLEALGHLAKILRLEHEGTVINGPVVISWDSGAPDVALQSHTPRALSSGNSTSNGHANGHEPPSSSPTEDLESL